MSGAGEPEARCPRVEFEVTAQRVTDYATALGDRTAAYRAAGRDRAHMVAPPTMAAAYLQAPVRALVRDGHTLAELGVDPDRILFGEVDYRFTRLARPGEWLVVDGELVGRRRSGTTQVLTFETTARDEAGATVAAAAVVLVCR